MRQQVTQADVPKRFDATPRSSPPSVRTSSCHLPVQQLLLETTTSLTGVAASSDEIIDSAAVRSYLHGVVVGPHWSVPTSKIVKDMPEGYAVRQYPDVRRPPSVAWCLPACR